MVGRVSLRAAFDKSACVALLTCACWHPVAWTPEGQRLVDEHEGRRRAPAAPNGLDAIEPHNEITFEDSAPPPEPAPLPDAGQPPVAKRGRPTPTTVNPPVMGYTPTMLHRVHLDPRGEWTREGYSDHGFPIGAEVRCPPLWMLSLEVIDERGGVTRGAKIAGIQVARKQDVGGYFTVKLKNLEDEPVTCDVKIVAILAPDP